MGLNPIHNGISNQTQSGKSNENRMQLVAHKGWYLFILCKSLKRVLFSDEVLRILTAHAANELEPRGLRLLLQHGLGLGFALCGSRLRALHSCCDEYP